jgi:hypothetical protein
MHSVNPEIGCMAATRGQRLGQAARRLAFASGIALIGGAGIWYGWS